MTKEIELAAEEEYPEKPKSNYAMYDPIQRRCQQAFIKGAQWMATRDRWVSVDEPPKKADWYIVACSDSEKSKVEYWDGNGWWNVYYSKYMDDITHYMPLPELPSPPQSKNNGKAE